MKPAELPGRWRTKAEDLKRFAPGVAEAFLEVAAELESAFREEQGSTLTLRDASRVCGYSEDYLGRLVKDGTIQNYGRPRAPRVKEVDLPRKIVGRQRNQHLRAS